MKHTRNQKGFSLIELIVVMGIIGFVIVGIGDFMLSSVQSFKDANNRMEAQDAVTVSMEEVLDRVMAATPSVTFQSSGNQLLVSSRGIEKVLLDEITTVTVRPSNGGALFTMDRTTATSQTFTCSSNVGLEIGMTARVRSYTFTLSNLMYFRNE